MARTLDLLLAAMLATSAAAMPAQRKASTKRSIFTVPVKARQLRAGHADMARVAAKYATGLDGLLNGQTIGVSDDAVHLGKTIVNGIDTLIDDLTSSLGLPDAVAPASPNDASTAASTLLTSVSQVPSPTAVAVTSNLPSPPSMPTSKNAPLPPSLSTFPPSAPPSMPTSKDAPLPSSLSTFPPSAPPPMSTQAAPSSVASPVANTATASGKEGEVTTTPEANDIEYLSPVIIGGQTLSLDFDTGSSDLWVYSSSLPPQDIGNHSIYDPTKSSTFTPFTNATWSIGYGDGSTAGGSVGWDVVNVGGAVVSRQCVEMADELSSNFLADTQSDGLLGLGFSVINTVVPTKQQTFFENIMHQLDAPVFTASLGDHSPGVYEFGTVDASRHTGDVHYTAVDPSAGYWTISVGQYSVGNQTFTSSRPAAIADTGTSLLYMNQDAVDNYYKSIPAAAISSQTGAYTYPCGTALPDLTLDIGGYAATIKGEDMTYEQIGGGQCFGGLQIVPPTAQFQIIGDMFLKQFFAVFDGGNMRFGVAERA